MQADAVADEVHAGQRGSGGESKGWRLSARAKLNLGLEILGRRPDGYHEIVSVTQTISLADTVDMQPGGPFGIEMRPALVGEHENLARRAGHALALAAGIAPTGHLTVRKRIPLAAGLGGGSSDAATALRLVDRAWRTDLGDARLAEIGGTLGSDVPLFIGGATNLIQGRGEVVEPLPCPPTFWVVLVTPDGSPPDKTRALYRALGSEDLSDGAKTVALAEAMRAGEKVRDALLVNGFDRAADRVYTSFATLRTRLADLLQRPIHLTGAGPTLFAIYARADEATAAARALRRLRLPARVANSMAGRPRIRASQVTLTR
jgi:4-diphosphocytidyl-2-C-methyl-D-erythritol kinase